MDELHKKNNYYIDITKIDGGCLIHYPANLMVEPKLFEEKTKYFCKYGEISVQVGSNNIETLQVVPYVVRPLVLTDFVIKSWARQIYDITLTLIHDENKIYDKIRYILPNVQSEEIFLKEKYLMQNITQLILGEFPREKAQEADVIEGYQAMCNLINKGGF